MLPMRRYVVMGAAIAGVCFGPLSGCTSNPQESMPEFVGHNQQGVGEPGRLTKAEWATFLSDQKYLHSIARPDVRIRLNLADESQYRFAMSRLKLAGKTPDNSPYLFKALEQRRQDHIAKGYKPGLLPQASNSLVGTADLQEMHLIEEASIGETTPVANDGLGTASTTFPGGAIYTYVDVSYTDASGAALGNLEWSEEFDGGRKLTINSQGNLALTTQRRYRVSSYKVEESAAEGVLDSYIYKEVGLNGGPEVNEAPRLTPPNVLAPLDVAFNDNLISVCLNRTWTQDCDYDLTGNLNSVKLPLQGSISVTSSHVFDSTEIDRFKTNLNGGLAVPEAGHLKLILTNSGGGCDVTDGTTLVAKMAQFWNRVTLSADKKTFSWDLTGTNAAFFDDGCRQVQDDVKLTAFITLPLISAGTTYRSSITLSNDPAAIRPDYVFKKITVTNSCLAAGTEIELAEGKPATIETLKAGDHVTNPFAPSLTVMDTAVGIETTPMVRIRSESGRSLLMTEMHPIQVAARGMVQARELKKGDLVMTRTGPSKLVEVRREAFTGKVYNVKVGTQAEQSTLGADQTAVYANGFLVGDGQIQKKYESIALQPKTGDMLARLPSRWHRDYQLSLQRR
ncbi:Hint domain-containing protein [Myxococcus sp. K15C18031901]|uniref:Hint domain-containing protein n=1 Tax=Myxococcus dinghuensis TaxID=2906761 RepID=UPI0020A6E18B|nr:Hint domain-containing protein [Myxococcus dinghuensis]MCP3101097.1 Hint domain-containing protein [Myxococcus dinghuensis]